MTSLIIHHEGAGKHLGSLAMLRIGKKKSVRALELGTYFSNEIKGKDTTQVGKKQGNVT